MNHNSILDHADLLRDAELPGFEAHRVFYANESENRDKALAEENNPRLSGVAAILAPVNDESHIVLIKRPTYKGAHSGQMAFPGGKKEQEDADLLQTALRETQEEVGVPAEKLSYLKPLTRVYIPPSRFLVYPHLFVSREPLEFIRQEREVESIVLLPVRQLLDDKVFVRGSVELSSPKMRIKTWYFDHPPYVIWGATALMLNELKLILKRVLSHD